MDCFSCPMTPSPKSALLKHAYLHTKYYKFIRLEASHVPPIAPLDQQVNGCSGLSGSLVKWRHSCESVCFQQVTISLFFCLKICVYGRFPTEPFSRLCILPSPVKVSVRLSFWNERQTHLSNLNKISVPLFPKCNQGYSSLTLYSQACTA